MKVKQLQEKLAKADPEAVVCIYDLFSYPPQNFYKVEVAEEVGVHPFMIQDQITDSAGVGEAKIFMLH